MWRLLKSADIFIHNMRPKKIINLCFGPRQITNKFPNIIFVGLHGYGEDGYYSGQPAFDDIIQGQSGIVGLNI